MNKILYSIIVAMVFFCSNLVNAEDISPEDKEIGLENIQRLEELRIEERKITSFLKDLGSKYPRAGLDGLIHTGGGPLDYTCDSGSGTCKCWFSSDCKDMEGSGVCDGKMICGYFSCTCDWL